MRASRAKKSAARAACLAAAMVVATLSMNGCNATKAQRPARLPAIDRQLSAPENLEARAVAERRGAAAKVASTDIALPPGVEPNVLALREPGDPRPLASLRQAIDELADVIPPSPLGAGRTLDVEAAAKVRQLLNDGRAAAAANRHLQAITTLRKALELDPVSTEVHRELARSYASAGNVTTSAEHYEQVLANEPLDSEATFTLGMSAANRRDFEKAVALLGRRKAVGKPFDHDPAAEVLANFSLGVSLRELGYDRAAIECSSAALDGLDATLSMQTAHGQRLASVYRQRGEIWRSIGDAHCRLGEFEEALASYERTASMPTADPAALNPRAIYANLRLGRIHCAQLQLYNALTQESQPIGERDIALCAYVHEHARPVELLVAGVSALHEQRPDDGGLVRAAASLMEPERARELLKQFVARSPRDLDGVRHLLTWQADQDLGAAVELAIALVAQHPDLADEYIDRLAVASPRPRVTIEAVREAPPSAARARVEAKLLAKVGGMGEAWNVCRQARLDWPDDVGLMLQELHLAAAMREAALLERSIASMEARGDLAWLLGYSQARRALGQTKRAVEIAQQAVDEHSQNADAAIELARAQGAHAVAVAAELKSSPEVRNEIDQAIRLAELAISMAPKRDEAYEVLALIYAPGGVLADTQLYRETRERLGRANPNSPLYARLAAQELIAQKRYEQALDRLLTLYESDPSDRGSLALAVTAWQGWGKLEAADQWLEQRLERRPGDPALLEQWVRVQVLRNTAERATERLEQALESDPDDLLARRLLEGVHRAMGQADSERELGEQRLLARPEGMRRELELATLYARAELADKAFQRLEWIQQNAMEADLDDLAAAIAIADQLGGDDARRDALALDLIRKTLERFPNAPLAVYRSGLEALARSGQLDHQFDELARRAASEAQGAAETTIQAAASWRELAQGLVDTGHPAAAARAVRARLEAPPRLEPRLHAALAKVTLVGDAAAAAAAQQLDDPPRLDAAERHAEDSIALVRALHDQGLLAITLGGQGKMLLGEGFYEASIFYALLGADAGADRILREAIDADSRNAMAMNNLGYTRLEAGRRDDQTIKFIEKAHEMAPAEPNILDTIGWLRYKQGQFDDVTHQFEGGGEDGVVQRGALWLVQRAIDLDREPSPEVHDHLGDIHWRMGDADAAAEAWRTVVRLMDEGDYAQRLKQNFQLMQARGWQLVVADPQQMYDREYGQVLTRARAKLEALEQGVQPPVAPTFAEMNGLEGR